jgi:hypothetical protein
VINLSEKKKISSTQHKKRGTAKGITLNVANEKLRSADDVLEKSHFFLFRFCPSTKWQTIPSKKKKKEKKRKEICPRTPKKRIQIPSFKSFS